MMYPSLTLCRETGIAHYKHGNMLELGSLSSAAFGSLDKNTTNSINPLAHTPDLSDFLAQIVTKHGSNRTTLKINYSDVENRETFFALSPIQ